jgi:hypothetical protein
MAGRILVRNRASANWPRESVEDSNDQLDGDQTLDILLGFATSAFLGAPISGEIVLLAVAPKIVLRLRVATVGWTNIRFRRTGRLPISVFVA